MYCLSECLKRVSKFKGPGKSVLFWFLKVQQRIRLNMWIFPLKTYEWKQGFPNFCSTKSVMTVRSVFDCCLGRDREKYCRPRIESEKETCKLSQFT